MTSSNRFQGVVAGRLGRHLDPSWWVRHPFLYTMKGWVIVDVDVVRSLSSKSNFHFEYNSSFSWKDMLFVRMDVTY